MPQSGRNWAIALILGLLSIPIAIVLRLIPDELCEKLVPQKIKDWSRTKREQVVITDEENPVGFNQALYHIQEELAFIKRYKGGRLNSLKFTLQHPKEAFMHSRSPSRSRASSSLPRTPNNEPIDEDQRSGVSPAPPTPESRRRRGRSRSNSAFAGAAMAGIVAGSIAGGWSPIDRREGDADSLKFARHRSKSDLSKEVRMEPHTETKSEDPILVPGNLVEQAGNNPPSQATETTPHFGSGPYGGEPSTKTADQQ